MVKAVMVSELGGPEVLKSVDIELGQPEEGHVKVRNKVAGLNFIDTYFRKGLYSKNLPYIPGQEAVGEVIAVGPGVTEFKVGDRVGYIGQGTYTEEQLVPVRSLIHIPESLDFITAAAVLLKGMTVQFLVRKCFKVGPEHTILVHAAAGGVGSLLCQWTRALGAQVIGCVSTEEKARQAEEDGCHHVIIYSKESFVERVKSITDNKGVHVVYDSVGKDTFQGSLDCLAVRGYMVSFGQSSGSPDPVPVSALGVKSLYLTRGSLFNYTQTREELLETANDLFTQLANGTLRVRVNQTYPLSDIVRAHTDLEGRKTTGSTVILIE